MGNVNNRIKRNVNERIELVEKDRIRKKHSVTSNNSVNYRGTLNQTVSGKTCQNWTWQSPHKHDRTPWNSRFRYKGLGNHNYCRNPDGESQFWCYTTDRRKRWEKCDINKAKQIIDKESDRDINRFNKLKRAQDERQAAIKKEEERQAAIQRENERQAAIQKQKERIAAIQREKDRQERERIRKIKEEEERKRLLEERRIQEIRDEKHNKHWNQTGKYQNRTFECDDVNGNRLGGRNLYLDQGGILYANEKSIALTPAQMKETVNARKLSGGRPNPNWKKHKLSSGNPRNFLHPYDPHTNTGDKIEHNGISLVSNNHIFKLEMTKEGNLVLKKTIEGCTTNYTKKEYKGDYKAFKTDASKFMNEYLHIDSADKIIKPISNEMLTYDNTYNYIGEFQPEKKNNDNMVPVKNKEECFKKGNDDASCEHIYYIESKTGNNYCGIRTGMPEKYIPIQPNVNIKKSSLYIKNKKMKNIEVGKNLHQSESYILDKYNKTLPNRDVQQLSNYTAYSDYEVYNTPITQYQDILGKKVTELKGKQRKMFEGFKNSADRPEDMPIKDFIKEYQIRPLEGDETKIISNLDKINKNYNKLDKEISSINNNDGTGLRDKLTSEDKYKDYLSTTLDPKKEVYDVRLDDTTDLINYNNSIFNLGIVTASTLLVAGIVIARE